MTTPTPVPTQVQAADPSLPDSPDGLPVAHVVPSPVRPDLVHTQEDTLIERDGVLDLDGHAVVTYQDRQIEADHITYDSNTGDMTATGHVFASGGQNDERIHATHGTYNIKTATGRFFEVTGSVGMRPRRSTHDLPLTTTTASPGSSNVTRSVIYTNANPFLFTGRMVVKSGPQTYDVYDGTITSCQLPHPDWLLSGSHFSMSDGKARASNSIFHLIGLPLLWLPYVTHPTDPRERQSGFLIPAFGDSSTRGVYFGEQIYLVLNRSADLTVGAKYYSLRGWEQDGTFRFRGAGLDFASARYSGLMDKLTGTANQGGEDILFSGRHDLDSRTRVATNLEYLSSYVYREAFTDNFNLAVTSDIVSDAYGVHQASGYEFSVGGDRYQGIKNIAQGNGAQQQVRIFHVPTFEVDGVDHSIGKTGLHYAFDVTASGLKRTQPGLTTSGIVERFDLHPEISFPVSVGLFHADPSIAVRETFYTRSRRPTNPAGPPTESTAGLIRSDVEFVLPIRGPVIAADFSTGRFARLVGPELRHTIEPAVTYRRTTGVSNFGSVLRFDAADVVSNTDEIEYGVTQRLFRRAGNEKICKSADQPDVSMNPALDAGPDNGPGPGVPVNTDFGPQPAQTGNDCGQEELLSWRLTQKYFIDQLFGGAVVDGRRNVFTTTLDLSGVAFLTEPRAFSPFISRLKVRTSAYTDLEWDFDYDMGASKFTSSNVFLNAHEGSVFGGLSYARLDAPGRFYTEGVTPTGTSGGAVSQTSNFNQLRVLLGYGSATKRGLSAAINLGLDLKAISGALGTSTSPKGVVTQTLVYPGLVQYTSVQTAYNWNCCGLAVEYRKFELGSIENTPGYKFSFTLANIGAAGDLRRTQRLF